MAGIRITTAPRGTLHRARDEQLITACRGGDEAAWHELIGRYGRLVYSIPLRYGLCEADADDVFQDVFAQLFARLQTLRDPARLASWLITTAHRRSCRAGRSGRYLQLDRVGATSMQPPPDQAMAWERQDLVQRALRELGGRDAQLLVMLMGGTRGRSYEAVCEALAMRPGSIGPTRARAFARLQRILERLGADERPGLREHAPRGLTLRARTREAPQSRVRAPHAPA